MNTIALQKPVALANHRDLFEEAVEQLADNLGAEAKDSPMPISKFKSSYGDLLAATQSGQLRQISRGSERFLVLSEEQVIAMMQSMNRQKSLAESLASIPAPIGKLDTSYPVIKGSHRDPYTLPDLSR